LLRTKNIFSLLKWSIFLRLQDDDELGFRKNDIITVVSQRDEHCWVGELNGHTGWFPAKLVSWFNEAPSLTSTVVIS
jgi:hypothetical protein